ncbi:MAG TPA: N-acetylneuraminate synthase family protein, partial [Polyangiales bacterium]|nr:N-acetylneuraminate synthase family protein [Polyangiales bacterium]
GGGLTQHDIFASRSRISKKGYQEMFDYARELGIMLLSTPFDVDAVKLLDGFGMAAFKIASADLTNWPLLEAVAACKKPMILSTGASSYDEIKATVRMLKKKKVEDLALLHCSLSYPTPVKDANLDRIRVLQEEFPRLHIGYSDHTQPQDSLLACPMAVTLGSRILEKHFTLNKHEDDDDHYHAVDAAGLARLVRDCKDAFLMTRKAQEITDKEIAARNFARRSIVAARALKKGATLTERDIDFKRPGTGMSPTLATKVLGKKLARDLEADELVLEKDLEAPARTKGRAR